MNKNQLPPLPFGEELATTIDNFDYFKKWLYSFTNSIVNLKCLEKNNEFKVKSFELDINGLIITSIASTPQYGEFLADPSNPTLLIPFSGEVERIINNEKIKQMGGKHASVTGFQNYIGTELTNTSWLMFSLDLVKLEKTAQSMLGEKISLSDLNLYDPYPISLQYYTVNFMNKFKHLCILIQTYLKYSNYKNILESLNIDDLIYRQIVMLLRADLFFEYKDLQNQSNNTISNKVIKDILEFVDSHIYEKITLSDLEHISNMSSRNIQLIFKKELRMSPLTFIREHRLELVHKKLKNADKKDTVTSIAIAYGFHNHSQFTKYYSNKFGVLPSQTLKKQ
jgi:AraC-like DNA-binding protein